MQGSTAIGSHHAHDSTAEPRASGAGDARALRIAALAATFAAAWLAIRVSGRAALPAERSIAPRKDPPLPVKLGAGLVSASTYPVVYLPVAAALAGALKKEGEPASSAVPRSALAAWLTYHVVKTLTHRERPPAQQGDANDDRSYPSGHAVAAAAIAASSAYLALRRDASKWPRVVPAAIGIPVLVGASRVALRKHWPSDIAGGFATGIAVAGYTTANRIAATSSASRGASEAAARQ